MEFNLKNRPRKALSKETFKEIEEWFEGFEKELREALKNQKLNPEWKPNYVLLIKEILGE